MESEREGPDSTAPPTTPSIATLHRQSRGMGADDQGRSLNRLTEQGVQVARGRWRWPVRRTRRPCWRAQAGQEKRPAPRGTGLWLDWCALVLLEGMKMRVAAELAEECLDVARTARRIKDEGSVLGVAPVLHHTRIDEGAVVVLKARERAS
jgi:hypothetical protein